MAAIAASAEAVSIDMSGEAARLQTVKGLKQRSVRAKEAAEAVARDRGWPIRGRTRDGTTYELMAITEDGPIYYITMNANAAISTATDKIRDFSPYNLSGAGVTAGVWDAGAVLATHQEFGGRVTSSGGTDDHSTHVGGTIAGAGVNPNAKGMAPDALILSYDWDNDFSEMAARAATESGQSDKLYLSNHSYGTLCGWEWGDWSGTDGKHWWGTWGDPEDRSFGQYNSQVADLDELCYDAPYYLPFWAAGNDRCQGVLSSGDTFYYYSSGAWHSGTYDPATHPPGDGWDGGYDTLGPRACAKNLLSVGAVEDAVTASGDRSLPHATTTVFSSWGPTDDGRIKPDVVGNGASLFSAVDTADNAYDIMSGTSMATPNVCGTATLLVEYISALYDGENVLASTLKALLIHTADDVGHPGPDYTYGWGLVNGSAAAKVMRTFAEGLGPALITESYLSPSVPEYLCQAYSEGESRPIRATLCWTDPPASALSGLDDPSLRLVNDLDLRIYSPSMAHTFRPYVLDPDNPSSFATTGDNVRDNVEQVYIAAPPEEGAYWVEVSYDGDLTDGIQHFSLIVTTQPDNDDFDERIVLDGASGQTHASNADATKEEGEPSHGYNPGGKSLWWEWTPPFSGQATIDTFGSNFNTLLTVYYGPAVNDLTVKAWSNDAPGTQLSQVTFHAHDFVPYKIAVDGYRYSGEASSGDVVLNWQVQEYTANDGIAFRIPITGFGGQTTGDNEVATREEGEPYHAGSTQGRSVWWTWTAPASGLVAFNTHGSDFDTALAVYIGSFVNNLTEVASNDNDGSGNYNSGLWFTANEGTQYRIAVGAGQRGGPFADTFTGNIVLNWGPANDHFADRFEITGIVGEATTLNLDASEEPGEPNHAGNAAGASVWWTWTAPVSYEVRFDTYDSDFDTVLAVYTGSSVGALTEVASNDDAFGVLPESMVSFEAQQGVTYQIAVDDAAVPKSGTDPIVLKWRPTSNNDYFDDAVVLVGDTGEMLGSTVLADFESGEPNHAGASFWSTVWWTWTAPASQEMTFDTHGSEVDTALAVYTGPSVDALTEVVSNNDDGTPGGAGSVVFCAEAGVEYSIAVATSNANEGSVVLNWESTTHINILTLFKDGLGSVRVNGILRRPLWANWYDFCDEVTLEPVPDPNWSFSHWTGDLTGSASPVVVPMTEARSITAVFEQASQYTLNLSGTGKGKMRIDGILHSLPWSGTFYADETVVLRPAPAEDWMFSHWLGDLTGTDPVVVVTMDGNKDITATFVDQPPLIDVTLDAMKDNTLYEDGTGSLSNGAGEYLFVGSCHGLVRRGLVAFDIAGDIPAGATITNAALDMYMSATDDATSRDIFLVKPAKAWGEGASDATGSEEQGAPAQVGDATWLHTFYNKKFWDSAGGDFDVGAGIRAEAHVAGVGSYTWTSGHGYLADDVQAWLDTPAQNFGWCLYMESESQPAKRFNTRENDRPETGPKLDVTYFVTTVQVGPTAAFVADTVSGPAPLTVQFTDQSDPGTSAITNWSWDFGDTQASISQNPQHQYASAGTYTVSLTVTTAVDNDTETKTDYIVVTEVTGPTADFTATPTSGPAPLFVQFTDQSAPGSSPITAWSWNFGDTGTSTSQNPVHEYMGAGTYTVSLTVTTAAGSDGETKTGYITATGVGGPTAAFTATPTSGAAPLSVQFTDLSAPGSSPITVWSWNFGDTGTSTDPSPQHAYAAPGTYTVSLTVTTALGSDAETKTGYVSVSEAVPPTAAFTANLTSGDAPLSVQFTDQSDPGSASITQWDWDFGDAVTSTLQNPQHAYNTAGTYTVALSVTTDVRGDTMTKVDYITVTQPAGEGEGEGELDMVGDLETALTGVGYPPGISASADLNGGSAKANGILDAAELYLIEAILDDPTLDLSGTGGITHATTLTVWSANLAQVTGDLGAYAGARALARTLAGYVTLGDDGSFALVSELMTANLTLPAPHAADYDQSLVGFLAFDGDADGDGYSNLAEWQYVVAAKGVADDAAAYAAMALDPAAVPVEDVPHSADTNDDWQVSATEIGRVVGFYNAGGYYVHAGTLDGYAPGAGSHEGAPHDSDYSPTDWEISAVELGRLVTFYNAGGYVRDPGTQDGFAPILP